MQMLIGGILIGVAGLIVFAALGMLLYYLRQASINLKRAADVFGRSAEMASTMVAQVAVMRQVIATIEKMTSVIQQFNGLVLHSGGGEESAPPPGAATRRPWSGTPPPPPVPAYEEFAGDGEAGILSQTDEEQAELDLARLAREQGIETDIDMVQIPPLSEMNQVEE